MTANHTSGTLSVMNTDVKASLENILSQAMDMQSLVQSGRQSEIDLLTISLHVGSIAQVIELITGERIVTIA